MPILDQDAPFNMVTLLQQPGTWVGAYCIHRLEVDMATRKQQRQEDEEEGMEMEIQNPIDMLREDHQAVQGLFSQFEEADKRGQQRIADEALTMLEIHAKIEEGLIYPAIQEAVGDDEMIEEALEEHHVATLLIKELRKMQPKDERYAAKFKVLSEMVKHHIEEEENETFPQAEKADIDWSEIAEDVMRLRHKLMGRQSGGRQPQRGRKTSRGETQRKRAA